MVGTDDYSFELKIRDEKNELQTTNINFHTMMSWNESKDAVTSQQSKMDSKSKYYYK